jgi:hypothetical protein
MTALLAPIARFGGKTMNTQTIMIQVGDRAWTAETLHSACVLARRTGAEIALVKTVPVQHVTWLGTDFGYRLLTEREREELRDYELTLEDYGIQFSISVMQYATLFDAIVQAAESVGAQIIFAQLPNRVIPYWHNIQMAMLRRRLAHQQRQLLEQAPGVQALPVKEPETVSQP